MDAIGDIDFMALRGNPEPLKEQTVLLARPGVEGVAVWKTAKRGVRFSLRSEATARDLRHGRQLYAQYLNKIAADPQQLAWAALDMDAEKFQVVVLDVRLATLVKVLVDAGGQYTPGGAYLEADWDLVAIKLNED